MFLLWSAALWAASPQDFPQRVSIGCPDSGVCRIEVPPPFVADNDDSWLLVSATGEVVPYAVLSTEEVNPSPSPARVERTADPRVLVIKPQGRGPVNYAEISFPTSEDPLLALLRVEADGARGRWTLVGMGENDTHSVSVPIVNPGAKTLRLQLDRPWTELPSLPTVQLWTYTHRMLELAEVPLTLGPMVRSDSGMSSLSLQLPGRGGVRAITLAVDEDVFSRPVRVMTGTWRDGVFRSELSTVRNIAGLKLDAERAQDARLGRLDLKGDTFELEFQDGDDLPLTIRSATASLDRRVLLVRDAGALTLYGGSAEADLRYDLQAALLGLADLPSTPATLGAVEDNPDWKDPTTQDALLPGGTLPIERFRVQHSVVGQGLVRLELPADLQAEARDDLSDVRLLDPQGRQVPFLIERPGVPALAQGLSQAREEQGNRTVLTVTLPAARLVATSLTLRSPSNGFSRQVRVMDASGAPLATGTWRSAESGPSEMTLRLAREIAGPLTVTIDNGDNRAIDLDPVELVVPRAVLLARLPADPVTLVYGDLADSPSDLRWALRQMADPPETLERLSAPRYDAGALATWLQGRPAATATLGPAVFRGPPVSTVDAEANRQTTLHLAIGALALGLVALVGWLVRDLKPPPSS